MTENEVRLLSGRRHSTSFAKFGVIDVDGRPDHPIVVSLTVVTDEEHHYLLRLGDTFPIRDEVWKLDRVENPQSRKAEVVLVKVEGREDHDLTDRAPDSSHTRRSSGMRDQVEQGALNDGGVMSTLGAVAGHRPEAIMNAIRERDDGNYTVRLHEARWNPTLSRYEPTGRPITMTVTPDLPISAALPHEPMFAKAVGAAWAPIMEKAIAGLDQTWSDERIREWEARWASQAGRDGVDPHPLPEGYVRLNKGTQPSDQAELLTQLTGHPAMVRRFPDSVAQLLSEVRRQLDRGNPVLVEIRERRADEPLLIKDLKPCHTYEVTAVDDQDRLHLRNPWNHLHPAPLTVDEFRRHVRPDYATMDESG